MFSGVSLAITIVLYIPMCDCVDSCYSGHSRMLLDLKCNAKTNAMLDARLVVMLLRLMVCSYARSNSANC
jgi:hypothetical protein